MVGFFVVPTHSALAQVDCTGGVPFIKGDANGQIWYFDTTAGTCSNAGPNPVDGFTLTTDDELLNILNAFNGGVATPASCCPSNMTAYSFSGSPGYLTFATNGTGVYQVGFSTSEDVLFNSVVTLTFQGIAYTVNIEHRAFAVTGDHHVNSMVITGGAFVPPPGPDLAPQAQSQQLLGSSLFMNQAGRAVSSGVGNAIAERLFTGGGTQFDIASNGASLSAYVSLHGIGATARDARASRLAMYETSPNALHAIETAFSQVDANPDDEDERAVSAYYPSVDVVPGYLPEASASDAPLVNVWMHGSLTHYDGDAFDGDTWNGVVGADYLITSTVLVGVLGGYEKGDLSFQLTDGAFNGQGFTAGAYVGIRLAENVVADAFFTHSWLDYGNRVGAATGDTTASRYMISLNVSGRHELAENLTLEPNALFFWAHENQDGYALSDGTVVAANSIQSGRLSMGPKFRYQMAFDDGSAWSIFASAHGEFDLSSDIQTNTALPDFDNLLSARLGLGVDGTFFNGWAISLSGDVSGLGSGDFTSYSGSGRLRIPFY
ncbi:MAG: autotransporter outer membrane beta-barrel domain-containing protein [Pseudomonadota bacterium]